MVRYGMGVVNFCARPGFGEVRGQRGVCSGRRGREFEFGLFGFWSLVFLKTPRRDGQQRQRRRQGSAIARTRKHGTRGAKKRHAVGARQGSAMARTRRTCGRGGRFWLRVFGHLCGPWVERGAFLRRKLRAVFGRVKTLTREEPCRTMSHPRRVPRAGLRCAN